MAVATPSILDEVREFVNNDIEEESAPPRPCRCCEETQFLLEDGQCFRKGCMPRVTRPEWVHCCNRSCHPERW